MSNQRIVIGFPEYEAPGQRLAEALRVDYRSAEVHRFPDDECKVRIPATLPSHTIFCRSLFDPDHKLIELLLAADAARRHGATTLTLVAPYLAYLRQDAEFTPGEAISAHTIGKLLGQNFQQLITVDPHLHRIRTLNDVLCGAHGTVVSAASAMARHIAARVTTPLLLGPDSESAQWVSQIAAIHGWQWAVANKVRHDDYHVSELLPMISFARRNVVLVDDMISTGRTAARAAEACYEAGAENVYCAVTHGLFSGDSARVLMAAGVREIWSSDSVPHATNAYLLAPAIAAVL